MKSKRGVGFSVKVVLNVVLAAMLIMLILLLVNQANDRDLVISLYASKDIATLITTAQAIPYDLQYQYPGRLQERNVDITNDRVRIVRDTTETRETFSLQEHGLTLLGNLMIDPVIVDLTLFTLVKEGENIKLRSGINAPERRVQKTVYNLSIQGEYAEQFKQELEGIYNATTTEVLTLRFQKGGNQSITYSQPLLQNYVAALNRSLKYQNISFIAFENKTINITYTDEISPVQLREMAQHLAVEVKPND